MADIDTSDLLSDPDFVDEVQLIRRTAAINAKGRAVVVDAAPAPVHMSVQGLTAKDFQKFPSMAQYKDSIAIWYNGVLMVNEDPAEYPDIVVWNSKRYQAHMVAEDFGNFGGGFVKVFCIAEGPL